MWVWDPGVKSALEFRIQTIGGTKRESVTPERMWRAGRHLNRRPEKTKTLKEMLCRPGIFDIEVGCDASLVDYHQH